MLNELFLPPLSSEFPQRYFDQMPMKIVADMVPLPATHKLGQVRTKPSRNPMTRKQTSDHNELKEIPTTMIRG